jgi:hypothetical protein
MTKRVQWTIYSTSLMINGWPFKTNTCIYAWDYINYLKENVYLCKLGENIRIEWGDVFLWHLLAGSLKTK